MSEEKVPKRQYTEEFKAEAARLAASGPYCLPVRGKSNLFQTASEVQDLATKWLWSYNHERPNTAIGGIPPKQKLAIAA